MIRIHFPRRALLLLPALGLASTPTARSESASEPIVPAGTDTSAVASPWARTGFSVGIGLVSNSIGAEDPGPSSDPDQLFVDEHGGGLSLRAAYAMTPQVEIGLSLAGARHATTIDELEVVHGTLVLDLRYVFLADERARPYVEGGLGGATLALDSDAYEIEVSGGAALLGAGVVYNLTGHLRLDAGARLELINWREVRVRYRGEDATVTLEDPVEDDGAAAKLALGLTWAF